MNLDTAISDNTVGSERIPVSSVRFVKELYPRLRENPEAIERYRLVLDKLPPIVVARDGLLVDGYHRWQAHVKEAAEDIPAINLGNLTDLEIFDESMLRNNAAVHGVAFSTGDTKNAASKRYLMGSGTPAERYAVIAELLAITIETARIYCSDARREEKEIQRAKATDLWLDCLTQQQIADEVGISQRAVSDWIEASVAEWSKAGAPANWQDFDLWLFGSLPIESGYYGRLMPEAVENLLWMYTKPGQIVFDPFAGGGTTIEVAKRMGRRVWSSDLTPSTMLLPIHEHNAAHGWPVDAPKQVDFILLDPPYWKQTKGRYSEKPDDLANLETLDEFYVQWQNIITACIEHLSPDGHIAYIIGPTPDGHNGYIDHATDMLKTCWQQGLTVDRRIIIQYPMHLHQAYDVARSREAHRLLSLYRDFVVLRK